MTYVPLPDAIVRSPLMAQGDFGIYDNVPDRVTLAQLRTKAPSSVRSLLRLPLARGRAAVGHPRHCRRRRAHLPPPAGPDPRALRQHRSTHRATDDGRTTAHRVGDVLRSDGGAELKTKEGR